ncbi:MAG: hypothetical protein ABSE70_11310 [Candidatus Limnocylindrales bacterium]
MLRFAQRQGRGPLILLTVMAIALSACGGSSATAAPGSSNNGGNSASANAGGNSGGSALSGAADAFSTIGSYTFSMTLAGGDLGSTLAMLGGPAPSGNAPFTYSGTMIVKPAKAADISMTGFHVIEIGGYDYLDVGDTGGFVKSAVEGTGMTDSLSPIQMFQNIVDPSVISGYNKVGSETKNKVGTDHYQASASALAAYGMMLNVTGATWTADVWIAQNGGYPVSMSILAKTSDNGIVYEIQFDITNINDPANKVTAPTNLTVN